MEQALKRRKIEGVQAIPVNTILTNSKIILLCEQKINERDFNSARNIIEKNEVLSMSEKADLCNKLCDALLFFKEYVECREVVFSILPSIQRFNGDTKNKEAEILLKLSLCYYNTESYSDAIICIKDAIKLADEDKLLSILNDNLSMLYNCLSMRYAFQGQDIMAENAKKMALQCGQDSKIKTDLQLTQAAMPENAMRPNSCFFNYNAVSIEAKNLIEECKRNSNNPETVIKIARYGLQLKNLEHKQKNQLYKFYFVALFMKNEFKEAEILAQRAINWCNTNPSQDKFQIAVEWYSLKFHAIGRQERWRDAEVWLKHAINKLEAKKVDIERLYTDLKWLTAQMSQVVD